MSPRHANGYDHKIPSDPLDKQPPGIFRTWTHAIMLSLFFAALSVLIVVLAVALARLLFFSH